MVYILSRGSMQVLSAANATLPHVANLYISTHPCRSVCDCSGVTSAAVVDVMNIFASLCKNAQLLDPPLCSLLIRLSD